VKVVQVSRSIVLFCHSPFDGALHRPIVIGFTTSINHNRLTSCSSFSLNISVETKTFHHWVIKSDSESLKRPRTRGCDNGVVRMLCLFNFQCSSYSSESDYQVHIFTPSSTPVIVPTTLSLCLFQCSSYSSESDHQVHILTPSSTPVIVPTTLSLCETNQ
jgi:hypothetical protein